MTIQDNYTLSLINTLVLPRIELLVELKNSAEELPPERVKELNRLFEINEQINNEINNNIKN